MIGRLFQRLRTVSVGGLRLGYLAVGVVVAAVLVVTGVLGWQYSDDLAADHGRGAAVDAANRAVVAMFSYDYNTAPQTLPAAAQDLTGDFKKQYLDFVNTTAIKSAQEKQISVHVDIRGTSVVSSGTDSATLLMFLDERTFDLNNPQAVVLPTRLRVEMQKQNSRWLVNGVTPL